MKIIKPEYEILEFTPNLEQLIERAGRVCYKSEDRITQDSASKFIKHLISMGHESVIEHGTITVRIICDRSVTHELVRHRLASYSQESTRYCNYSKDKHGAEITFVDIATGFEYDSSSDEDSVKYVIWKEAMQNAENSYFALLKNGATPQEARSVLPNSLKTEIVVTANPREWRTIFKQRCGKAAHPQIREIMLPLLKDFSLRWDSIFGDLKFA